VPGFRDIGAFEFQGSSADTTPAKITATYPAGIQTASSIQRVNQLQFSLSEPVSLYDAISTSEYELRSAGTDGLFDTTDDSIFIVNASYIPGSKSISLTIPGQPQNGLPAGKYRLTIRSNADASLHDLAGNSLDGDANGTAGGDYVKVFTVGS